MSDLLSKRAQQWAKTCGIGQFQLRDAINEITLQAAVVVAEEIDRVIDELNLKSLATYTSQIEEAEQSKAGQFRVGGLTYRLKVYRVYVINNTHAAFSPSLNVFDILDSGRKELPPKTDGGVYPLWSYSGIIKVPVKPVRNLKTGRFSYRNDAKYNAISLRRPEPRAKPGGRYKLSANQKKLMVYTRGPVKATPARNLYKRIFKNADKALRRAGLPNDMISLGPRKR